MRTNYKTALLIILLGSAHILGQSAFATESADPLVIEEIIVTAEKNESNLQDTAIAVSAFTSAHLERANIEDASDLQFSIPNSLLSRNVTLTIRGVGNNARSTTADAGVGFHSDGVYLTSPNTSEEFYDLERVEVLRGPQGTLYGRNTSGGVVNYITQKPTNEFEGGLTASVASFDSIRTKGFLNLPITESLAARLAFNTVRRDGYTENIFNNTDIDGRDQYSIRTHISWQPTDQFSSLLTLQYFNEDSNRGALDKVLCTPDATLGCSPSSLGTGVPADYLGSLQTPLQGIGIIRTPLYDATLTGNPSNLREVNFDTDPTFDQEIFFARLEFTLKLENMNFTSITGFQDFKQDNRLDSDGLVANDAFNTPLTQALFGANGVTYSPDGRNTITTFDYLISGRGTQINDQISQEFQLSSNFDGPLNFTAGLFWMEFDASSRITIWAPDLAILGQLAGLPITDAPVDTFSPEVRTDSWAVFGEFYYDISEDLTLTVGLRYTEEDKSIVTGSAFGRYVSPADLQTNSARWEEVTGKINLSYDADLAFTDSTLLYTTLSRGYKAGGLNPANPQIPPSFDPEFVNAIEIGAKNKLFGGRAHANFTFFYYDYKGLQLSQLLNTVAINENSDAKIFGAEFELVTLLSDSVLVELSGGYQNTEILDFSTIDTTIGSSNGVFPFDGNELPNAPKLSVKLGIQYSHPVFSGLEVVYRLDHYWQDSYWARVHNTVNDELDSWNQTDLQITLSSFDGNWEIELFVKNLEDNDDITFSQAGSELLGRTRALELLEPRLYGLTGTFRW